MTRMAELVRSRRLAAQIMYPRSHARRRTAHGDSRNAACACGRKPKRCRGSGTPLR